MSRLRLHVERHAIDRIGWLRAAVLGANELALLGGVGARAGGARMLTAILRVTFWGAIAMAMNAGIGQLFGAVV